MKKNGGQSGDETIKIKAVKNWAEVEEKGSIEGSRRTVSNCEAFR